MTTYESPAKLNLALLVFPPQSDGYHPLRSTVQTIEWCDRITFEIGQGSDQLEVAGQPEVPVEDNLVLKALAALREESDFPPLSVVLEKEIPVEAGLGGGSSNAAAVLAEAMSHGWVDSARAALVTRSIGADVALFAVGGTLDMSGIGDAIKPLDPLEDFAVAVVVPEFGISTASVYRRWDALEGPIGDVVPDDDLPPTLRDQMPMRNDLLPAALSVEPRLGDFMADVGNVWGTSVCLTGSGSACFGYFASVGEAEHAARSVEGLAAQARGVALRPHGVAPA